MLDAGIVVITAFISPFRAEPGLFGAAAIQAEAHDFDEVTLYLHR